MELFLLYHWTLRADIRMHYPDVLKPFVLTLLKIHCVRMSKTKDVMNCIPFLDFISLWDTYVSDSVDSLLIYSLDSFIWVQACKILLSKFISALCRLAANWPPTMQIVRLISQDHMNNKYISILKIFYLTYFIISCFANLPRLSLFICFIQ